jgi:SWI/SNF-related matrix-associated actin-dependent regulator of chromatin subfamily A-like protein 1
MEGVDGGGLWRGDIEGGHRGGYRGGYLAYGHSSRARARTRAWHHFFVPIGAYRPLTMNGPLHASLEQGEAVLRFPYDDRLRRLLRAIPGRRWDADERAWMIPLDPERAQAVALLLSSLPRPPLVSAPLARALERRSARRPHDECVLDLARPDDRWWLTFATDNAPALVTRLLEHPLARRLPTIGRALIPLDERAVRIVASLPSHAGSLRVSEDAEHALTEIARRATQRTALPPSPSTPATPPWHGTIDVAASPRHPVFLLLGDPSRLPGALRERGVSAPGGVSLPLTLECWRAIEARLRGFMSAAARRCVAALEENRPPPPAVLELSTVHDDPTFVLAPGHDASLLDAFATLTGASPHTPRHPHRAPSAPHIRGGDHRLLPAIRADPFCVEELDRFLVQHGIWVEPQALVSLQEIREQHAHAAGVVALSSATASPLEVDGLGGELKPFQRAGVSYLLAQRRAFLADEQGLGKTIEALATLQADDAFPAVVVCPASLKLNWVREIERWLPLRSVHLLAGRGPAKEALPAADITVANYEILDARTPALAAARPRALVLDESHYCKNAAAKRTQAVARLAASIPADGLVLALTGTPVMNRPPELISQLRILGRLADFGSGAQFGRRFRGPDAHLRLHWHLRARCFARRLKSEVLPQLPPKTRTVVPIELDNEPEYRLAEQDVIAWLRSRPLDLRELDAKVAAALRAERLVRLGALKQLAARGKLHAALAWIHDFCSSGERLVVFARHREVQRAVLERFPTALHILGEDSPAARHAALEAFQAQSEGSSNQLIVCSIEVAGQGLTLTRASNVAFLELDWTPAKHDQAEDRCHRIGQADAVNAWYLLAAGTVDEKIAALLERKRAVIAAVTDGREQSEEAIVDALARELAEEPYRHLRAVA